MEVLQRIHRDIPLLHRRDAFNGDFFALIVIRRHVGPIKTGAGKLPRGFDILRFSLQA